MQVVVAEGDYVFVWGVVEGTRRSDFFGVPPTGRKIRFDAPDLYRIADGKIAEEWAGDDGLAILAGLGAYTPPGCRESRPGSRTDRAGRG